MFESQEFQFDCTSLLDEVELSYQELRDAMGLPLMPMNKPLMRSALIFLLEDSLNKLTDPRFRDQVDLTKNLMTNYFEFTERLDDYDMEDIMEIFIKPMLMEASSVVGKLIKCYDRYYSKWEIIDSNQFPFVEIHYLGDYRIDEWHRIQDVPSKEPVIVKQHRIRYDDLARIIRDCLADIDDELAVSDIKILIEKIIDYYTGEQLEEFYNEILNYVATVNGCALRSISSKVHRQTKLLIRELERSLNFGRFVEDTKVSETIYVRQNRSRYIFDCVLKGKSNVNQELRQKVLDEIETKGYVERDIVGKVEIIYGD